MENTEKFSQIKPFIRNLIGYSERVSFAKAYLANKVVLDLGCVDHNAAEARKQNNFIHDQIREHSGEVLGTDIDDSEIKALANEGYNVAVLDIQNETETKIFANAKKFDTIFAGEIIEHLEDIRSFFKNCRILLRPEGVLVISTPNAMGFPYFAGTLKLGSTVGINPTHTLWFDPITLISIAENHGFRVINFSWYFDRNYLRHNRSISSFLYYTFYLLLIRIRPYFSEGFEIVLKRNET